MLRLVIQQAVEGVPRPNSTSADGSPLARTQSVTITGRGAVSRLKFERDGGLVLGPIIERGRDQDLGGEIGSVDPCLRIRSGVT